MADASFIPVIKTADDLRRTIRSLKDAGKKIGFVPTMGALHSGHMALVQEAKNHSDAVITSIFVNPTQFGPSEDFSRYPRTLEQDLDLLHQQACDIAFVPDVNVIYPQGFSTYVEVEGLSAVLDGVHRPGHFRGVATVVARLLNLVAADYAFFGEKDYQQLAIIKRMVRDLNLPIEIMAVSTAREADGLALSSRNRDLTPEERETAPALYRALCMAREDLLKGRDIQPILETYTSWLKDKGFEKIDYFALHDAQTLMPIQSGGDMANGRIFTAAWSAKHA
ncbi:MAG: pantoate--beta-alanine ligase [Rickettsiales bacterium]